MTKRKCCSLLKCVDPRRGISVDRQQKRQWSQDVLFMSPSNHHKLAAMSLPLLRGNHFGAFFCLGGEMAHLWLYIVPRNIETRFSKAEVNILNS